MLEEKKTIPALQVFRHQELTQKTAALTEDIEELKSVRVLLLNRFTCTDDHSMIVVKQRVAAMESSLKTLNQQEDKYAIELEAALTQYADLQKPAVDVDATELEAARQVIRSDKEREAAQRLQTTYQKKFDSSLLTQSRKDVANLLNEVQEPVSIREKLRKLAGQSNKQRRTISQNRER